MIHDFRPIKKLLPVLLCLMCVIVLTACQTRFDENVDGLTVFRYNEASGISSLDPIYARNQSNIWVTSQLFNSLLQLDTLLQVKPAIAEKYTLSESGLLYTFYLRDDVFFHDNKAFAQGKGRRVVASDFVYSFSRLMDPSLNSPGQWIMNSVKREKDGSLAIKALSDTVLQIELAEPFPAFTGLLCMQYGSVVPHEAVEFYGAEFRSNPVGTGPFYFKYWKEGVRLVLRKHPNYFEFSPLGERLPFLDAISVSFVIDRQTAFLEFIKGNIDFLSGVDASYKDELLTPAGQLQSKYQERFYKITKLFLNTEYLGFLIDPDNERALNALQKKKIRQAINYGFDRSRMLQYLRNNIGIPAYAGFVPPGMPGFYENTGGYSHNPTKAASLLAQAGFPNGEGLPAIVLYTTPQYLDISQFLQFELSRLGIRLQIDVTPSATLREMLASGTAPFFRASWIADYPDAENYLALFYTPNRAPAGPNYTRFSNTDYDKLYETSISVVEDSLRVEYYKKMDDIVIEHAPVVLLYYDQSVRFLPHYVRGMHTNPLNHLILKHVYMDYQ